MLKNDVKARLAANAAVSLEVTKADGQIRIIEAAEAEGNAGFGENDSMATVWDNSVNGYRRFAWSRLNKVDGVAV